MKKLVFLLSSLLIAMTFAACSNGSLVDEPEQPGQHQDGKPTGKNSDNGKTENENTVNSFFTKVFPPGGITHQHVDIDISGFEVPGRVCMVIKSSDEFESLYKGEEQLPYINFSKHALVVGKVSAQTGCKYLGFSTSVKDQKTIVCVNLEEPKNEGLLASCDNYYFWGFVKVSSPKDAEVIFKVTFK